MNRWSRFLIVLLLFGLAPAIGRGDEKVAEPELVEFAFPVTRKVSEAIDKVISDRNLTMIEFVQFFGVIVYEGSEVVLDKEKSTIRGKLDHRQAVLFHLVISIFLNYDEEELDDYLEVVFEGGCEFCSRKAHPFSFSKIASTS